MNENRVQDQASRRSYWRLIIRYPLPALYCLWAFLVLLIAFMAGGFSAENCTRGLVIIFLLWQVIERDRLVKLFSWLNPRWKFVMQGTLLAAVVEGFHMISVPVFKAVRFTSEMSAGQMLTAYVVDLVFTVPAYLVIFNLIWYFINRYQYSLWKYIILMGIGQMLGDGGLPFFLAAPPMILFLPYPTTNYHAVNLIPFLAVRDSLNPAREKSAKAYLVVPALIATYFLCGCCIRIVGSCFGYE